MKLLTVLSLCLLIIGCKEKTIDPSVDQGTIIINFNGTEVKFDKPYIHTQTKTNDGLKEYITAAVYKESEDVKKDIRVRYTTTIRFTEDLTNMTYAVRDINFSIAAFKNDQLINMNDFYGDLPTSKVSFNFTTNKMGKVVGNLHGNLLVEPGADVIPEIINTDGILKVTGQFDLNFNNE